MRSIFARELNSVEGEIDLFATNASATRNVAIGRGYGDDLATTGPEQGFVSLTWEFESLGGLFELWAEYAAAGSRPMQIVVNDRVVAKNGLSEVTYGWHSQNRSWIFQSRVKLASGLNRVTVGRDGPIPHIRCLRLRPATEPFLTEVSGRRASPQSAPLLPLTEERLAEFVRYVAAPIRRHLADGIDPATITTAVTETIRAITADFSNPQKRIGFSGPFNGQVIRQAIFVALDRLLRFDTFLETGAHLGATTAMLASYERPVYSCESNPDFYYRAAVRLLLHPNVTLLQKDSRAFLRDFIAKNSHRYSTPFFYLDAHWYNDLPLPEEITIIADGFANFVIMVDDFKHPQFPYAYDRYQSDVALTLEYILPKLRSTDGLSFLFPIHPEGLETGARRGTLVIAPDSTAELIVSAGVPLMRY